MSTAASLAAALDGCLDCDDRPAVRDGMCPACLQAQQLRINAEELQTRNDRLEAELAEARRQVAEQRRALARIEALADDWEDNAYARPASYGQCAEAIHLILEAQA